jgi:Leucine-rich repeat (LRR) protein
LNWLDLSGAAVQDVTLEASLPNLNQLDLSDNQLTSVEGLNPANVPELSQLVLDRNPLFDLSSIAVHDQLGGLSIVEVGSGASDLSPLAEMASLESLVARGNDIADLSPVAHLPALDLASNRIADLGPLSAAAQVRGLDLSSNLIEDASPLTDVGFTTCAWVSLQDNPGEGSFSTTFDTLCGANVEVAGYCLPEACDPCPPDAEDCG